MNPIFASLLIAHVLFGLLGVIASFQVTLLLLKDIVEIPRLIKLSFVAFVSYVISWVLGGWYYWKYYGTNVKPSIVNGDFAWAHAVFMEAKEHVFLFLPFASLCIALLAWKTGGSLQSNATLKKKVIILSLVTTTIAVIITLSGILITGGAR